MPSNSIGNDMLVVDLHHCHYFNVMSLRLQYLSLGYTKIYATARLFLWVPAGRGTRGVPTHQEALEDLGAVGVQIREC